jgi:hypothetical protein
MATLKGPENRIILNVMGGEHDFLPGFLQVEGEVGLVRSGTSEEISGRSLTMQMVREASPIFPFGVQ